MQRSSTVRTSTTSTRSSRSRTPRSTRRCTSSPTTRTRSSRGTTRRARGPRSTSSTRRPSTPSGTARPTWTGRSTSIQERIAARVADARSTTELVEQLGFDLAAPRSRRGPTASGSQHAVESQNWSLSQFMHGEQGALDLHREDRRDGAVDRREVLRVDPGDGRGPSRRGLRQVPRHEAVRPLPDQRPPPAAARRHHQRQPLGHDLPGHADHGRGPGPGRVRPRCTRSPRSRCSSSCSATS